MSEQAFADWRQKLFEISTQALLCRDEARRKIEIERLVHECVEFNEAVIKAPAEAKHWRQVYGAD